MIVAEGALRWRRSGTTRRRSGDLRGVTLVEIVLAMALLAIATVGALGAFNQATSMSGDANLNQELHGFAEAVLEESEHMSAAGLFAFAGPNGRIFPAPEGAPTNMVAVLRCRDNTSSPFEVDVTEFGLPSNTTVRVVRVHVQALFVTNPDAVSAAALAPLTGRGIPHPFNLVGYRLVR